MEVCREEEDLQTWRKQCKNTKLYKMLRFIIDNNNIINYKHEHNFYYLWL